MNNKMNSRKIVLFMAVFMAVCALGIYLYINWQQYPIFQELNNIVYSMTGKNLMSGRQIIWKNIFDNFVYDEIFFGYGVGFQIEDLSGVQMSAHNQFIQIIVQQGLLGVLLIIGILIFIAVKSFEKSSKNNWIIVVGIILYNMFEVFLVQNHFSIGLVAWLIMFSEMYRYTQSAFRVK